MSIKGKIRTGDIIWMDAANELIEIVGCLPESGEVHYWTSKFPKQVETRKCKGASAWIIFRHGLKVGSTQPTTNDFRAKVGLK